MEKVDYLELKKLLEDIVIVLRFREMVSARRTGKNHIRKLIDRAYEMQKKLDEELDEVFNNITNNTGARTL